MRSVAKSRFLAQEPECLTGVWHNKNILVSLKKYIYAEYIYLTALKEGQDYDTHIFVSIVPSTVLGTQCMLSKY